MSVPTPHIEAKLGGFADTVIMPGDPKRSKMIAEKFLDNATLVNDVRGVQGYTGDYNGKRVSVMASGMGHASIGIYSYELFNMYDVKNIIRIGTCGSFVKELRMKDLIIVQGACERGNFTKQYNLPGHFSPIASFELLEKAVNGARDNGLRFKVGNMLSSDIFYDDANSDLEWAKMGVLGVEMESAALYSTAARAGKNALTICTVTDSFVSEEEKLSAAERQESLTQMIKLALEIA